MIQDVTAGDKPPDVPQIVADLLAPLVRAQDLATLLDVQGVIAGAIGEAQRGITTATAAGTISRVLVGWEDRLRIIEALVEQLRGDIELIKVQVAHGE